MAEVGDRPNGTHMTPKAPPTPSRNRGGALVPGPTPALSQREREPLLYLSLRDRSGRPPPARVRANHPSLTVTGIRFPASHNARLPSQGSTEQKLTVSNARGRINPQHPIRYRGLVAASNLPSRISLSLSCGSKMSISSSARLRPAMNPIR